MVAASPLFDAYVMVDWSANSTSKRGRDSIWFCHLRRTRRNAALRKTALVNPATRSEAMLLLRQLLLKHQDRALVGFDFPNAYPRGFAAAVGCHGPQKPWLAVWETLCGLIQDRPDNSNNRYRVAAALNRAISGGPFPFWGCPAGQASEYLSTRKLASYTDGLPERRLCERYLPSTQPCWKLAYTGSVGSQALLGIPVQRALRFDPELRPYTRVWPFETGLSANTVNTRIVLAEVYPSIIKVNPKPGQTKDALQVEAIARRLAERDGQGLLTQDLLGPPALSAAERRLVEREEGWILGAGTLTDSACGR